MIHIFKVYILHTVEDKFELIHLNFLALQICFVRQAKLATCTHSNTTYCSNDDVHTVVRHEAKQEVFKR